MEGSTVRRCPDLFIILLYANYISNPLNAEV
jgi:hypothetical protein